MTDVNEPNQDRAGNDYREGPTPQPGGETDVDERTIPPYEDRSTGDPEVAAGVPRAMGSEEPLEEPTQPGADGPDETDMGDTPPAGTGESVGRRGEDVVDREGSEPGREKTGDDDGAGRPHGESDPRDRTSIDPHDGDENRPT